MKHRCKLGLVPAILALLCCSGPVRAGDQLPFQGTCAGLDQATLGCPVVVRHNAEGQATHLGRFTFTGTTITTPDSCGSTVLLFGPYLVTLTAANGDQLYGTDSGYSMVLTDPIRLVGDSTLTITGGTGRFANSTGTIDLKLVVAKIYEATSLPDGTLLVPAIYQLNGTLSSVGSDKR